MSKVLLSLELFKLSLLLRHTHRKSKTYPKTTQKHLTSDNLFLTWDNNLLKCIQVFNVTITLIDNSPYKNVLKKQILSIK